MRQRQAKNPFPIEILPTIPRVLDRATLSDADECYNAPGKGLRSRGERLDCRAQEVPVT